MKVHELTEKLSKCDPNATVLVLGEHREEENPEVIEYENASDLAVQRYANPRRMFAFAERYGHTHSGKMVVIEIE